MSLPENGIAIIDKQLHEYIYPYCSLVDNRKLRNKLPVITLPRVEDHFVLMARMFLVDILSL